MLISQHSLTIAENVSSMNVWWKKDGDLSASSSFGFNETLKVFKLPVRLRTLWTINENHGFVLDLEVIKLSDIHF